MDKLQTTDGIKSQISKSSTIRSIKNGGDIVQALMSGILIKDDEHLMTTRTMFKYIFVLMGLKSSSIPNSTEKMVLFENVVKYYGHLKAEEIKIAYQMVVNGELIDPATNKPIKTKLFGDVYSFDHFSHVMKAYIIQKRNEVLTEINKQKTQPKEPDEAEKQQIRENYINNCILKPIQIAKESNTKPNFGMIPWHSVYLELKKANLIDLNDEKRKEIKREMTVLVKNEWKEIAQNPATTPEEFGIKKMIQKSLSSGDETAMEGEIIKKCYEFAASKAIELNDYETIKSKILDNEA